MTKKAEKILFFLIVMLSLYPAIVGKYYPSFDGAAHLYNSNIISELIVKNNPHFENFFAFNNILAVPNWTGHFILSFFNLFLPAFLAEKILLLTYLIGLPYSFRSLIKNIKVENIEFSYLIFPFCYSFPFILGFYNFSIAIVLLLVTLNFWLKSKSSSFSIKKTVLLAFLLSLLFFSHVFIFTLVLIFITLNILHNFILQCIGDKSKIKIFIKESLVKSWHLSIAAFLPLLFFIYYSLSTVQANRNYTFLETHELIEWIIDMRPIIAYDSIHESGYTHKILFFISLLFLISIYKRVKLLKNSFDKLQNQTTIIKSDFWLIVTFFIGILYFTLPDTDQVAGYFSVRFGLLLFIFLIIWMSTQKIPKWILWISVAGIIYFNFKLNSYYNSVIKTLNHTVADCEKAAEYIDSNSIVLPINFSDNWMMDHFSNYLGVDKPLIILENYELEVGYFPLRWKNNSKPNVLLGKLEARNVSCFQWNAKKNNIKKEIEYVFILGDFSSKTDSCSQMINKYYKLIYENKTCSLYKIKNDTLNILQ